MTGIAIGTISAFLLILAASLAYWKFVLKPEPEPDWWEECPCDDPQVKTRVCNDATEED